MTGSILFYYTNVAFYLKQLKEYRNQVGVKLCSRKLQQLGDCLCMRQFLPVGTVISHRIIRVNNGQYTAFHRNCFTFEPQRITFAIPPFVVLENPVSYWPQVRHRLSDTIADHTMTLHFRVFSIRTE